MPAHASTKRGTLINIFCFWRLYHLGTVVGVRDSGQFQSLALQVF